MLSGPLKQLVAPARAIRQRCPVRPVKVPAVEIADMPLATCSRPSDTTCPSTTRAEHASHRQFLESAMARCGQRRAWPVHSILNTTDEATLTRCYRARFKSALRSL